MASRGVRTSACVLMGLGLLAGACAAGAGAPATYPPKPTTPPALTRAEMRTFLRRAPVVAAAPIGRGTTRPWRLTLSDGTTTWDAAFQAVDLRFSDRDIREGRRQAGELRFVDSYKYNIAAYELAELLGLGDMVPVTVERKWDSGGRDGPLTGALSWWVSGTIDEGERRTLNLIPTDPAEWDRQLQRMVVFGELVYDTDRNLGNILITRDWRIVMIDFSRAFRLEPTLRLPETLLRCDRRLLQRMRTLTAAEVRAAVGEQLTQFELAALMARRDLIVARFDRLIEERGADRVLYGGGGLGGGLGSDLDLLREDRDLTPRLPPG